MAKVSRTYRFPPELVAAIEHERRRRKLSRNDLVEGLLCTALGVPRRRASSEVEKPEPPADEPQVTVIEPWEVPHPGDDVGVVPMRTIEAPDLPDAGEHARGKVEILEADGELTDVGEVAEIIATVDATNDIEARARVISERDGVPMSVARAIAHRDFLQAA